MALEQFTKDMAIISALSDEPNDVDGLTSSELKAKFDEAGVSLQAFLNEVLLPSLDAFIARRDNPHEVTKEQVGLGVADNTADADKPVSGPQQAAFDALDAAKADKSNVLEKDNTSAYTPTATTHPATKGYVDKTTAGVVLGQIPDGSLTTEKLAPDVQDFIENTGLSSLVLAATAAGVRELEDTAIEAGTFTNAGAGWNTFTFREAFDKAPIVTVTAEDFDGIVQIKDVTAEGFSYCLRTLETGSYYTASGTSSSSANSANTLVKGTTTTETAVKVHYMAIEYGGDR